MARLTAFQYRHGKTFLHRRDVRFKLLAFIALTLSSLHMPLAVLAVSLLSLLVIVRLTGTSFGNIIKELRYFLLLLSFVLVARALFTEGTALVGVYNVVVTREGLYDGTVVCLRLGLTVLASLLLVATTRISDIRSAIVWLLKPVPLIPETRIATMIGLLVRFLPVILNQAAQVADAQRARCVENRRNPLYRLPRFALPLMRRTFITADRLAVAMEARCFSENRTEPAFNSTLADWLLLIGTSSLYAGMLML